MGDEEELQPRRPHHQFTQSTNLLIATISSEEEYIESDRSHYSTDLRNYNHRDNPQLEKAM